MEAYFVGRSELLSWINNTLDLRLSKIEETASGAVACQLMDALHPGLVPLKKVDFNAKNEWDWVNNYKVLQDVFNKLSIDKQIEVNKLVKARPLDNMEFMQWFYAYFESQIGNWPVEDYDAAARRLQCKTGDVKGSGGGEKRQSAPRLIRSENAMQKPNPAASPAMRTPLSQRGVLQKLSGARVNQGNDELAQQIAEWKTKAEMTEKEKDFYYSKLRDIEVLCQTPIIGDIPVMKKVEAILYAPTAQEGHDLLIKTQEEMAGAVFQDCVLEDNENLLHR